jgi:7-cyano-7-deazaguanine synthase
MGAIVLFSGGMDSTIAFFDTLNKRLKSGDGPVHSLAFSYGQRHAREVNRAGDIWTSIKHNGSIYKPVVGQFIVADLTLAMPRIGTLMGEGVVKKYRDLAQTEGGGIDSSFIPHRNMLFLTIAAQYAVKLKVDEIVTGLRGGYPDCTEGFEEAFMQTLRISDPSRPIRVTSPVHISRADSIALATSIPECLKALAYSLTCFEGIEPPCGHCLPCMKRAEGFAKAGIEDPLLIRLGVS